jgi:hypothetical protein
MARLTAARGLVTSSNELSRPDGALTVADNTVIDFDGVIQQRKGYKEYSQLLTLAPKQLFTYKSKILTHYDEILAFDSTTPGTFNAFSGTYNELVPGLRIKSLEASGNFYFTTDAGVKVLSVKNTSEFPTASVKQAGAVEATDLSGKLIPDAAGFLPAQSKVAYRLVFGYKDPNNNLHLGTPSSRVILTNQSSDIKVSEIFTITVQNYATIADNDYVTFDTLDTGYFIWFKKTGSGSAPVTADTVDREGLEVDISNTTYYNSNEKVAAAIGNVLSSQVSAVSVEITASEVQVTVNSRGDTDDTTQGNMATSKVLVTKIIDGSITAGTPTKAQLNFTLPTEVGTNYFYQLYRTAIASVDVGVTLNDVDPGDEMNFVFESPITDADVIAGEITTEDNTPETFRGVGAYLYTNSITGEGITQANARPPIAQDVASFRNSAFYGNTKDYHTHSLSILSVDDFISGTTKFYVGREGSASEYTFVGISEVTDVVVQSTTNTTESSYFTINSANDERQYYVWADKGAGVDPAIAGKQGIRIPLELYDDTIAGSKQALLDALFGIVDFTAVDFSADTIRITCTDAGPVTAPTFTDWSVTVVTTGDGEDDVAREVLLSQSSSVGIAIDLTARSLVRVINKDSDSPVTAQYMSGPDDLPGKILFKAKTLEDLNFYLAISDSSLSAEFTPELPPKLELTSVVSGVLTTSTNHNLFVGDEVYINDAPGASITELGGKYKVLTTPSATTFTIATTIDQPSIAGYLFKITAASDNNKTPNRVYFSKANQPEAVPITNYIDVGSKDKAILRILSLRDSLFCLKEDGIFIITGSSTSSFSSKLLDNSAILIAPDSAVVLNNLIYCLTTQGVVSISDSGVSIVSRQIEDQIKKFTTFNYNYKYTSFGVSYESDRAYFLWLPTTKTDTVATQCFRYSTITNTWTRWVMSATCGIVNFLGDDRMYLGSGSGRNYIQQERKNNERQDYSDRDFTRQLGAAAVVNDKLILSSVVDIAVGDVITQSQYLTVPKFNRFLKKLDSDSGPAFNNYYANFAAGQGVNFANTLIGLVAQLNSDPNLVGGFVTSGTNTIENHLADFNAIVTKINLVNSGTIFKDYKELGSLITYEVEILSTTKTSNAVIVDRAAWFIQGDVQIYKSIAVEVEYAPQHFGKPEELKQISEGTIIFDQGTISNASIGYASDRSLSFVDIAFKLDGTGAWGSFPWITVPWGGESNERGQRTLIPQNKSRCKYLHVRFKHSVARQQFKLLGISLEPRDVSKRAYR